MSELRIELVNCEATLLDIIARPGVTRKDVATMYALAIRSSEHDRIDWSKVNRAIMARWPGHAALLFIKRLAWKGGQP